MTVRNDKRRRVGKTTLVQLRVPDDLLGRIDEASEGSTRTAWLLDAAERELDDACPEGPVRDTPGVTHEAPAGASCVTPGVACSWARCWARNTARYGVTDPAELTRTDYGDRARDEAAVGHPLCPAHAARLARPGLPPPRHACPAACIAGDRAAARATRSLCCPA